MGSGEGFTILPVMICGCEARSLRLREQYRLRIFENRILRRIFGHMRDAIGEWERLYDIASCAVWL